MLIEQLKKNASLDVLPWTDSSHQLRQRLAWMHQQVGVPWPGRDLTTLLEQADTWLGPSLESCLGWSDISSTALEEALWGDLDWSFSCLLYTSPSPRDLSTSRMPSSA